MVDISALAQYITVEMMITGRRKYLIEIFDSLHVKLL